jgi:tRNA (adenine22-N1)-methyltransferase
LKEIAAMVSTGASVADVGCDHGKLAVYLALRGSPLVVATDVSSPSLAKAKQLVKELGLQEFVRTRAGDGLNKVRPGEVDTIVIAGMGGPNICSILSDGINVVQRTGKLVLQPMNAVGAVRSWIADNGFTVVLESIAEDDGRLYQVIGAVPGVESHRAATLFDLEIGHLLVERRHPLLGRLLAERVETIDKILSEVEGIVTPKAESRRIELNSLKARCVEVQHWLAL